MGAVPSGVPKRPGNARAQTTTIRKSCTEGTSVATAPRLARAPQRAKGALALPVTASLRGRPLGGDCARARSPTRKPERAWRNGAGDSRHRGWRQGERARETATGSYRDGLRPNERS